MQYFLIILLPVFIFSCSSKPTSISSPNAMSADKPRTSAKRAAPKEVQAILVENISYSTTMSEIIATDTLSKKSLWKKEIYKIIYDENLERDVQDVYIDSISVKDNLMVIRNENNEFYTLNLETLEVKQRMK